jgi:hypothetical protein
MALYSPLSRAGKAIGGIELIRGRGGLFSAILRFPRHEAGASNGIIQPPLPRRESDWGH